MASYTIIGQLQKQAARLADKLRVSARVADDVYVDLGDLVQDIHVMVKKNYADIKRFLDRKKNQKDDAR